MEETDGKATPLRNPVVTVLVAVYNTERYLCQCLDSLRQQTLTDIQVVCIDDCSTDNSLDMLNVYSRNDGRFEVIHLDTNHGQAYARNRGLEKARGEYICFLDSDDWMSDDCLEKAVDCFVKNPETDAVLFDTLYEYPEKTERYPMPDFGVMTGKEAFEASLTWKIHGVYIVRGSIHKRFPYDETSRAYSDDNTTRLHYLASREVRTCSGVYHYRQHDESVTHKPDIRRFDYLKANASMKRLLEQYCNEERILNIYENVRWLNVVDTMYFVYNNRKVLSEEEMEYGMDIIKETWKNIETNRLAMKNKWKFGYIPFRFSWILFKIQENVYFCLKSILFH